MRGTGEMQALVIQGGKTILREDEKGTAQVRFMKEDFQDYLFVSLEESF